MSIRSMSRQMMPRPMRQKGKRASGAVVARLLCKEKVTSSTLVSSIFFCSCTSKASRKHHASHSAPRASSSLARRWPAARAGEGPPQRFLSSLLYRISTGMRVVLGDRDRGARNGRETQSCSRVRDEICPSSLPRARPRTRPVRSRSRTLLAPTLHPRCPIASAGGAGEAARADREPLVRNSAVFFLSRTAPTAAAEATQGLGCRRRRH